LPFQQQRDVSSLFQSVRPQAAQSLFQAGQGLGGLGTSVLGQGISSIYGATAAGRDIIQQQMAAQQAAAQRGQSIGQGLFGLINKFGLDKINWGGILGGGPGAINLPITLPNPGGGGMPSDEPTWPNPGIIR